jgi:hypothetical protein
MPPSLFALGIFQVGAGLECDPPFYTSWVAGISGMCHHAQFLLIEMGFHEFFAWVSLMLQSFLSLSSK